MVLQQLRGIASQKSASHSVQVLREGFPFSMGQSQQSSSAESSRAALTIWGYHLSSEFPTPRGSQRVGTKTTLSQKALPTSTVSRARYRKSQNNCKVNQGVIPSPITTLDLWQLYLPGGTYTVLWPVRYMGGEVIAFFVYVFPWKSVSPSLLPKLFSISPVSRAEGNQLSQSALCNFLDNMGNYCSWILHSSQDIPTLCWAQAVLCLIAIEGGSFFALSKHVSYMVIDRLCFLCRGKTR